MSMDYLPLKPNKDEKQESDIVGHIKGRFDASRRFDRDFKLDCLDDWYYLQSVMPDGWDRRFYTNQFIPETNIAARAGLEQTMATLFPRDTFFDLWGDDGQSDVSVELMREKMKRELLRCQYKIQTYMWGMETINYGNGVVCTYNEPQWTTRSTTQPIIDPNFGVQVGVEKIVRKEIDNRLRMRVCSRFDLFPFPGYYNDVQTMPYFIVREYLPLVAFKERAKWKGWKNADKVEGWMFSGRYSRDNDDAEVDNLYTRLEATGYGVTGADHGVETIKFVELWHYYEAPPGGHGCRAYAVVADGKTLMCERGNEYEHAEKPIADLLWAPIDSQLWQGVGVPRLMRPFQDQINVREAQFSDMLEYQRNPMRIVGPQFGVTPLTKLLNFPGQITQSTGNIQDIRTLEMPVPQSGLLQLADRAQVGIERCTLTDMRGAVGQGAASDAANTTAKGKQIYTDNQAKSAAFMTLFQEERGISVQLQQVASIIQQYMNEDGEFLNLREKNDTLQRAGRVQGNRAFVKPEDIEGKFTLRAVGSVRAIEGPERAMMLRDFSQIIFGDPQLAQRYSKVTFAKKSYEMLFHRSLSEFEKTDAERQEEAQMIKPLPPQSLVKYKEAPADVQRQIEMREGFKPSQVGGASQQEQIQAKTKGKIDEHGGKAVANTLGGIVEAHAKPQVQPKYLPQRQPTEVQNG